VGANGNKLFLIFVPISAIIFAYLCLPYAERLPTQLIEKLPYAPYLLIAGALALSGIFKKHRETLITVVLGGSYLLLHNAVASAEQTQQTQTIMILVGILLPLNFAFIGSLKERQILSIYGLFVTSIIILQVIAGIWLLQNYANLLFLTLTYSPSILSNFLAPTLPPVVILSFTVASIFLLTQLFKKGSVFEIAFLGSLLSTLFYFNTGLQSPTDSIFIALSALIFIWGLIHNSYLIAYIDELTELPARRAMNEEMTRLRGQYAIAMLDIDHFKKFNDTYGHDVGDQVLRMVAGKIGNIGGNGKPFRYGGEEFAILFPNKDSKAAFPYLSNLRETIDSASLILRNQERPSSKPDQSSPRKIPWQEVHVTISIGVANTDNQELISPDDVIKAADQALYRSKEKGRNRISQYSTKDYDPELDGIPVE